MDCSIFSLAAAMIKLTWNDLIYFLHSNSYEIVFFLLTLTFQLSVVLFFLLHCSCFLFRTDFIHMLASVAALTLVPSVFLLKRGHQLCGTMHDGRDADVEHAAGLWRDELAVTLCNHSCRAGVVEAQTFLKTSGSLMRTPSEFNRNIRFLYRVQFYSDLLHACDCMSWFNVHLLNDSHVSTKTFHLE